MYEESFRSREEAVKKVLFYTNIPSPYRVDFFNELGKYCNLTVLFETAHSVERNELWKQYRFENFKGIIMSGRRTAVDMAFCPGILEYLKKDYYDVIFISVLASLTSILAVEWLKLHKIPYVYEGDGGFAHAEPKWKYWLKKNMISGARFCFSTSRAFDSYCKRYGAAQDKIIRYPFTSVFEKDLLQQPRTIDEKKDIRKKLGVSEEHMMISVGQMIYRKGFDILLKAIEVLDDSWGIYLVGGQETSELAELRCVRNACDVHYIEFLPKEELWEYYQAADLFVLPTRNDPWGLVVNEAMANAVPVITTLQCAAGLELIADGVNGYLYDCEDVGALKNILNEISRDTDRLPELSERALRAAENYTIEKMVTAHVDFIMQKCGV